MRDAPFNLSFAGNSNMKMKYRFILSLTTLFLFSFLSAVQGKEDVRKYVSTVLLPEGVRILRIEYPCEKHPTASVEVRLLTPETIEHPGWTAPLFFEKKWKYAADIQGDYVKDALDECYFGDEDDFIVKTLRFEDSDVAMKVLGWVGAFGLRDTVLRAKMKNPRLREDETTLVFPNASRTPIGDMPTKKDPFSTKAFGFDLVGREFEQPCTIRVWVIRGDEVMIDETLTWGGRLEHPYVDDFESVDPEELRKASQKKDDFFDEEKSGQDSGDDDFGDDEDSGDEDSGDEDFGGDDFGGDDDDDSAK